MPILYTRRDFSVSLAALIPALGSGGAEVISHTAEAIHQEVIFNASPERVYSALTDTKQFAKVEELSGVMTSGMLPAGANKPAQISGEPGGAFSLFGGYITGRQVELVHAQRVVQAWRTGSWPVGRYSIAHFELAPQGSSTKLVFDHTGFPKGAAESLASGWDQHYWQPMAKFLA
jgi:activator of HSP90 ATPase